jgi:hypothetical protein
LEVIATTDKLAAKLQKFLRAIEILDGGFPVKTEIPLMLGVNAVVTFDKYESWDHRNNSTKSKGIGDDDNIDNPDKRNARTTVDEDEELFSIPAGFTEVEFDD